MTAVQDPPTAGGTPPVDLNAALRQYEAAKLEVKEKVVESDELVDALFTGLASCTHVYVAGEGGVGKTFATEKMRDHLALEHFYIQFRADTKREEVFGPLSMTALQADRYEHVTKGYAPDAHLWVLDEIKDAGRFNRQLLNGLNERWMVNGSARYVMPLMSATGATNFWMEEQELAALFDRFAQRLVQEEIKTSEGFKKVLRGQIDRRAGTNGATAAPTIVTLEQIVAIQQAVDVCKVADDILEIVDKLWQDAKGEGLRPSPRRWGEGLKLAQAVAVMSGRDFVTEADLRIFSRVLPNHPDDFGPAKQLTNGFRDKLTEAIENANASLREITDLLAPAREQVAKGEEPDTGKVMEARTHFKSLRTQIAQAKKANQGRDHQALDKVLEGLTAEEDFIKEVILGI